MQGIISERGEVLGDDGEVYFLPNRGTDSEGYREVIIDAKAIGGAGSMYRQSIKPFIGMKVSFDVSGIEGNGYNYKIINNK